jgi:hypothetical protein
MLQAGIELLFIGIAAAATTKQCRANDQTQ